MPISKVLSTYLGIRNRSDIKLSKMLCSTKYFPFLLQNFFLSTKQSTLIHSCERWNSNFFTSGKWDNIDVAKKLSQVMNQHFVSLEYKIILDNSLKMYA